MILKASQIPTANGHSDHTVATKKVLHLINGEHFAGAERVQDLLANALPRFGYEVEFACLKPGKFSEVRTSRSKLMDINMRGSWDLMAAQRIQKFAFNQDYQLIHAHTPRSLMIGAIVARKMKLPLVYHVHSPVGRDSTRKLRNRLNTWAESFCLRNVSAMICVSGSLADYMSGLGHDKTKLHVVRNGVPAISGTTLRTPPGQTWTLGTMALYRPRKGIECLLEALSILKDRKAPIQLRAVGGFETPEYEAEVKSLAKDLDVEDRIDWTGFQQDVNAQFDHFDLFVLPSLFGEGLPMVVLESMANGVPVIASNVEGIPEAVRDGEDGLIFEPGSALDLANKVQELVLDDGRWSKMSENAQRRQQESLSDRSMAAGVANVYDKVMQLDSIR